MKEEVRDWLDNLQQEAAASESFSGTAFGELRSAANDSQMLGHADRLARPWGASGQYLDRSIDELSPARISMVRGVERGPMTPWRTWRRVALSDGGWLRVLPIDSQGSAFGIHLVGPWAELAYLAGLHLVDVASVASVVESYLDRISSVRSREAFADINDTVTELGLDETGWGNKFTLSGGHSRAVAIEIGRHVSAVVARGRIGLRLKVYLGASIFEGEGLSLREITAALTAIDRMVETNRALTSLITKDARAYRMALAKARSVGHHAEQVLWACQESLDLVGELGTLSLPGAKLPDALRTILQERQVPLAGFARAEAQGDLHDPSGDRMRICVLTPTGPAVFSCHTADLMGRRAGSR